MRRFLTVLILIFSLQSLTKADDISDFEIEGMSVGDSALDYFTEDQLNNLKKSFYPNSKKFFLVVSPKNNFKTFDNVTFHFKENDEIYIIYALNGALDFPRNSKKCFEKQKEIKLDLDQMFPNTKAKNYKFTYPQDESGNSQATITDYEFDKGEIRVFCTDWSKKMEDESNRNDNTQVAINGEEFMIWLNTDAYK